MTTMAPAVSVSVIADSLSPGGVRLTTMSLRYPRFVHGEFMTHRQLSRNASSSRAIPVSRMASVDDMAEPVHWGRNRPGMQAREELDVIDRRAAQALWRKAGRDAIKAAADLAALGCHKQIANRVSEPWQFMSVIVTATDYENFFALRCHDDADPTMQALAWAMADAYYRDSTPVAVGHGYWHVPYVDGDDSDMSSLSTTLACSVARCARVSYRNHDGSSPDVAKDLDLAQRLADSGHWSPFEHQAMALEDAGERSGNFRGWRQYRQMMDTTRCAKFSYDEALARRPAFTVARGDAAEVP